jgi:hypothetical protein
VRTLNVLIVYTSVWGSRRVQVVTHPHAFSLLWMDSMMEGFLSLASICHVTVVSPNTKGGEARCRNKLRSSLSLPGRRTKESPFTAESEDVYPHGFRHSSEIRGRRAFALSSISFCLRLIKNGLNARSTCTCSNAYMYLYAYCYVYV